MKPIKKSNSGLLLSEKVNLFKMGNASSVAYNKHQEKENRIVFELEKYKDTIVKLELELNAKDKELNALLNKNKKNKNKFQKTIKLIEQILKICDSKKKKEKEKEKEKETDLDSENKKTLNKFNNSLYSDKSKENYRTINIENDTDTDNYNKTNITNIKTFYTTNNNYNRKEKSFKSLPKIKQQKHKLTINTNYNFRKNKKFKDISYVSTLRNRIDTLNDEIGKKDGELIKLKNKTNNSSFSKLQTDFISNYNTLSDIKSKNVLMLSKLDDIAENYFVEKDKNDNLNIRLEEFQESFYEYKKNIIKKIGDLENKLKIYDEKNRQCIFNHFNKGNILKINKSFYEQNKSKLTEAENIIENTKKEINTILNEIEIKNSSIKYIQKEIENLKEQLIKINNNNSKNNNDLEKLNEQKKLLNENNKDLINKNNELKNKLKEKEKKYINEIYKIGDIKKLINEKDKNIDILKKEIEELRNAKKYNFSLNN